MSYSPENLILQRKYPRWKTLTEDQQFRLLEQARYRTYRARGNGVLIGLVLVVAVASFLLFVFLPSVFFQGWYIQPLGAALTIVVVFCAHSIVRTLQMAPEIRRALRHLEGEK